MSQKHLSRILTKLADFKKPKISLEQYMTNPDVAAELLWSLSMKGFIKEKEIIDLGAGTGMLGIGAILLGAKKVTFVEKDLDSIETLKRNIAYVGDLYELGEYEIINEDISNISGNYDLVIMNPPFGTKIKRVDTMFVMKAIDISENIFSIHKTSTKEYIINLYKENNYYLNEIFDFQYSLKKTFEHHMKNVKKIDVSGFFAQQK